MLSTLDQVALPVIAGGITYVSKAVMLSTLDQVALPVIAGGNCKHSEQHFFFFAFYVAIVTYRTC